MKTELSKLVEKQIETNQANMDKTELAYGEIMYNNSDCQVLTQSAARFELFVDSQYGTKQTEYTLDFQDGIVLPFKQKGEVPWDRNSHACLLQTQNELSFLDPKAHNEHKKYTRDGMIKRVLKERMLKAEKANYRIKWAANIYGDHVLTNENGVKYKVFLRDFETETGYSDSMDSRYNKLGTTKHLMFAFKALKENKQLFDRLDKTFPFIEVYCDPLNDYKITWHFPYPLPENELLLISRYFGKKKYLENTDLLSFLGFIEEAPSFQLIKIRPEVQEKIEAAFDRKMLEELSQLYKPDFSMLKISLFDYQQKGIEFALFRKVAIIADEMGLGKTIQAIGTAILKKQIFGFEKVLVVCPASLKEQWKKEVEKFTNEKAIVIQGGPHERKEQYNSKVALFYIVNYEAIVRDKHEINQVGFEFLILDEAQRIKNYETKTAASISKIQFKHVLAITGTPLENKLIDIFSVVSAIHPDFFGPLWEFSYQYCLFDPVKHNKINGYYNLNKLNKQLEPLLLRREKRHVLEQLPNISHMDVPVRLTGLQSDFHSSYARGIASIIRKKFMTPFDLQKLMLLLSKMRMVCDSTYLVDEHTNDSPKLDELKQILIEQFDLQNTDKKIIIFSEWVKVHKLIGQMLRENNIGFAELNGSVPVKLRGELIKKFETNPHCKVFLSTEAGGSGLNLQIADTLINFELPWNPAKKNQRIGRIDRLGQKNNKLTIINFITKNSIEEQIAAGLLVKQNLFEGVLGGENQTNFVDFTTKGRSQFIQQLESFILENEKAEVLSSQAETDMETSAPLTLFPDEEPVSPMEEDAPEGFETTGDPKEITTKPEQAVSPQEAISEMENIMNNGMQFLSGLFKMTTGKDMGISNQSVSVNKETGEVVMKFKIPV